jgi:hypothetical protein
MAVDEYTELDAKAANIERDYWLRWVRQSRASIATFERGIERNRREIDKVMKKWSIREEDLEVNE